MAKRAQFVLDPMGADMIATGHVAPVNKYDPNLPAGAPRVQETDEQTGLPLWVADFLVEDGVAEGDDPQERANVQGVRFASRVQPVFKKYAPVRFTWLRCSVYVAKTGQLGLMYTGGLPESAGTAPAPSSGQKAA